MALSPRKFCLDFNDGSVSASQTAFIAYQFRKFFNGDVERLSITLVEKDTVQPGKLNVLSPTGCTLKVALGAKAAGTSTVYTSVTLSVVGNQFVGDLPLNVAAVAALFASQTADVSVFLEFELTDGNPQTLQFATTIGHQIISTALADTIPGDRALGFDESKGIYIPKAWPTDGTYFQQIVNDSDGTGRRYLLNVYDGVLRLDPLT